MAKVRVDARIEGSLLLWVDAYAQGRGVTRTDVIESALREFRGLSEGGVPVMREPLTLPPEPRARPRRARMSSRRVRCARTRRTAIGT